MICDCQEVQRPNQLNPLTRVRTHFFTPGETKTGAGVQAGADQAGVEGKIGMKMRVAKKYVVRIRPAYER